jgi:hypothetical protein
LDFNMEFKFVPKPDILLIVVSGVLFITTFLPWWGSYQIVPGGPVIGGYMGFHGGGYLTFLMSLVGIATSFLESQKTRGIIAMGAGIVALLGVIIGFATLGLWGVGFGLIIALIASIGLGVVGFLEYRKSMGPGASGAYTPPAQTPPAQTPPSAGPSGTPSPPQPPPPPPPPPK